MMIANSYLPSSQHSPHITSSTGPSTLKHHYHFLFQLLTEELFAIQPNRTWRTTFPGGKQTVSLCRLRHSASNRLGHINNLYNTTFWNLILKGGMTNVEAEKRLAVSVWDVPCQLTNFYRGHYLQTRMRFYFHSFKSITIMSRKFSARDRCWSER